MRSNRSMVISHLLKAHERGDGARETVPVSGFDLELLAAGARERIELRAAIVLARPPLGAHPAFLLELVQRRVEGSVADLEDVGGQLLESLPDRPPVHRLEREHLEDEEVQRALHEVVRLAHGVRSLSVTDTSIRFFPSVSKRKVLGPYAGRFRRVSFVRDDEQVRARAKK